MNYLPYLVCLFALSAAVADKTTSKNDEDIYEVNCVPCKSATRTVNGTKSQKWQFMRGNCSDGESVNINITKSEQCNKPNSRKKHATVVIEKKHTVGSDNSRPEIITSVRNETISLGTYEQIDLYATIDVGEKLADCEFIVEFNYNFTCTEATTTGSPVKLENTTPASRATSNSKVIPTTTVPNTYMSTSTTNTRAAVAWQSEADPSTLLSSAQRSIPTASPKLFTSAHTSDVVDTTLISTRTLVDYKHSSCTVERTSAILLGILFAASLIALVCVITRYRRLKVKQQGEAASTNGDEMGMKSNDDIAETRVNEIYNMQ